MNTLDLLEKHGCPSRKVGSKNGGEWHSPCPTCGGGESDPHGHSDRMELFPHQGEHGTWYCRGCAKGGDAIEFLIFHENLSFPEACKVLGKALPERQEYQTPKPPSQKQKQFQPPGAKTPAEVWQQKANDLVGYAHSQLRANDEQLTVLSARGISSASVHKHLLGWLPGENGKPAHYRSRKTWGIPPSEKGKRPDSLWIPRGIVIPQIIDDQVQRIRIRRPEADRDLFLPDRSYHVMPGSGQAPLLIYNGQKAITVVEAELDGIMIEEHAGNLTGVLAIGNDSAKPDTRAHAALCQVNVILVALDFDKLKNGRRAGGQAWIWWSRNYRHAIRWPVPIGKDPGDAYKEGLNINHWIRDALPPTWTEGTNRKSAGGGEEGTGVGQAQEVQKNEAAQAPRVSVPPGVERLGKVLTKHKFVTIDLTGGGCRIDAPDNWRKHFWDEFGVISNLVFGDGEVFDYLLNHPDKKIDGRNFWKRSQA